MNHLQQTGFTQLYRSISSNTQVNQLYSFSKVPMSIIREVVGKKRSLAEWKHDFLTRAEAARAQGEILVSAIYYRWADFFMHPDDPDKESAYASFTSLFRLAFTDYFAQGLIAEERLSYEGGELPVWRLAGEQTNVKRGTVLIYAGVDSYKEELLPVMIYFRHAGYEVAVFEGPGQGAALRNHDLHMSADWGKPLGAVLDHLGCGDVTLLALSLGRYSAPRPAHLDCRVKRFIVWDVMNDYSDVLGSWRGRGYLFFIEAFLKLRAALFADLLLRLKMRSDSYACWDIMNGMHIFGAARPVGFYKRLKEYYKNAALAPIERDFLVIKGRDDNFTSQSYSTRRAPKYSGIKSRGRFILPDNTDSPSHCACGNVGPVLDYIADWVDFATFREGN